MDNLIWVFGGLADLRGTCRSRVCLGRVLGVSTMATPFPIPVTAAQVPILTLSHWLFLLFLSLSKKKTLLVFRLGRTSWGNTIRFFSNSRTSFISSTPMPAPCFASMATPERLPLQCWYFRVSKFLFYFIFVNYLEREMPMKLYVL